MKFLCSILLLLLPLTAWPQAAIRYNAQGEVTSPTNLKIPATKAVVNNAGLASIATPGAAVYYNGSAWALSRANAQATARVDALVESVSGNNTVLVYAGEITLTGLTAGSQYYLSSATAGATTVTVPTTAGTYRTTTFTAISTTKAVVKIATDPASNNLIAAADLAPEMVTDAELTTAVAAETSARTTALAGKANNVNPTLQSPTYTVAAVAAANIDWATGDTHTKTLSANTTFTFSNAAAGKQIVVAVTNTASNYTVAWPTVLWSGGTQPTQTVGAKTDIYTFIQIGSTIYGTALQNF